MDFICRFSSLLSVPLISGFATIGALSHFDVSNVQMPPVSPHHGRNTRVGHITRRLDSITLNAIVLALYFSGAQLDVSLPRPLRGGNEANIEERKLTTHPNPAEMPAAFCIRHAMTVVILIAMLWHPGHANANTDGAATPTFSFSGFGTAGVVHSNEDHADFAAIGLDPNGAGYSEKWSPDIDSNRRAAQRSFHVPDFRGPPIRIGAKLR
jgi:hypothetical protein